MTTTYHLHTKIFHDDSYIAVEESYIPLTATTDRGARRQAKKIIAETGIQFPDICFKRASDGYEGTIGL